MRTLRFCRSMCEVEALSKYSISCQQHANTPLPNEDTCCSNMNRGETSTMKTNQPGLILALILASCFVAAEKPALAAERASWQSEWSRIQEEAKKEGQVVIYFWPGGDLGQVFAAFHSRYPDVKIVSVSLRNELGPRILTEQRAGKYLA